MKHFRAKVFTSITPKSHTKKAPVIYSSCFFLSERELKINKNKKPVMRACSGEINCFYAARGQNGNTSGEVKGNRVELFITYALKTENSKNKF